MNRTRFAPVALSLMVVLATLPGLRCTAADDASVGSSKNTPFVLQDSLKPVVFIGDDATDQRMFSTLIETYTLSRFPSWKIRFRNTGWAGDKLLGTGLRAATRDQDIRRDIQALGPQFVLVNYGMNDARGGDAGLSDFLTDVNILSRDLPRVGLNHAAFASSNPEEGYVAGAPAGSDDNLMLQKYADGMKERVPIGWKDGVAAVTAHPKGPILPLVEDGIFIDVLNPMIALISAGRKAGVLSPDELGDKTARLVPDGIHPNWPGHFIMASLILQGLHAPDLVSAAVLDGAARTTISAEGCAITWQDAPAGILHFQRTDAALPWPTPPDVDLALKLPGFDPAGTLNRYELKVSRLKDASYTLSIDGVEIGTYARDDLANGINLGFMRAGPIYDQSQKLLAAVIAKNDLFFHRWREVQLSPPTAAGTSAAAQRKQDEAHLNEVKPQLDLLDQQIANQEQAIRGLCQPVPHLFQLKPVTK